MRGGGVAKVALGVRGGFGRRGVVGLRAGERLWRGVGVGGAHGRGAGAGPQKGVDSGFCGEFKQAVPSGVSLSGLPADPGRVFQRFPAVPPARLWYAFGAPLPFGWGLRAWSCTPVAVTAGSLSGPRISSLPPAISRPRVSFVGHDSAGDRTDSAPLAAVRRKDPPGGRNTWLAPRPVFLPRMVRPADGCP